MRGDAPTPSSQAAARADGQGSLPRDWMVTARISNLPTVLSNVLAGYMLAAVQGDDLRVLPALPLMLLGGAMLYTGGMILNDAADARVDRLRGVVRPVAIGRIGVRSAFIAAAAMLLGGAACALAAELQSWPFVLLLLAAIVGYDLLNKRLPAAILLMGLCRGLLVLLAASASGQSPFTAPVIALAAAVTVATTLITVVARDEHRQGPTPKARLGVLIGFVPAALFAVIAVERPPVDALVVALLWTASSALLGLRAAARILRPPIDPRGAIMGWLAALPLLDAAAMALSGSVMMWQLSAVPVLLSLLTMAAHRRLSGT